MANKETFKKKKFTDQFLEKQKKLVDFIKNRAGETKEEEAIFKRFQEGVEKHFSDPSVPRKFHLSHVFDLNLNWDILFLYSKKDVGKTWQIVDYINKVREEYPDLQICYIRNTKEEVDALNQQFDEARWPIYMKGRFLYWKNEKRPGIRNIDRDKKAGFVSYPNGASGFTKWQGSGHEHVRVVVWDECNSLQGGLTIEVIRKFQVFLSSIIRDKTGVKTFMFGNHLKAGNIFLSSLNVSNDARLKIIKSDDGQSTLLYLNTGDMYEGIERQKGLPTMFGTIGGNSGLLTNVPSYFGNKNIYEESYFFLDLMPFKSFVFSTRKFSTKSIPITHMAIYLAKDPRNSDRLGLWMEEYTEDNLKPGYVPFSCDDIICNSYEYVRKAPEEYIGRLIRLIKRKNFRGFVWYGNNGTYGQLQQVWADLLAIANRTDPMKKQKWF